MVNFLKTADRMNNAFSRALEVIGVLGMLTILIITCVDVIGAKLFLWPVPGSLDIVMQAQLIAVAFSMASTLMIGRHIKVEFFLPLLPQRLKTVIGVIIQIFCFILFGLIVWRLAIYGYALQTDGEVSATVHIPLYPFAYGIAVAALPICLKYLIGIFQSILGINNNVA